jgi:hypothetical protein
MLNIDRMRLHLPEELRERAPFIARMVVKELGKIHFNTSFHFERLNISPVSIPKGAGDQQIATTIARSVRDQLMNQAKR